MYLIKYSFFAILPLFIYQVIIQGCKEKARVDNSPQKINIADIDLQENKKIDLVNQKWKDYINLKSDSISNLYTEQAVKIFDTGNTLVGNERIKDHYQSKSIDVVSIYSDTIIMANKKRGLEYEIGGYKDDKNVNYKHIIIWESKNSKYLRVFEFVVKMEKTNDNLSEIDSRRELWMKLCNVNNSEALVNELYSINTLYFNHKPLIVGRELLVEEYQYMNRENYELALNPIVVEKINENFVFEIGQCKGSYNGKYIIIWRKNEKDKWEVFIDSNI